MINDLLKRLAAMQTQGGGFPPVVGMAPPQQPIPGGGQALQPFMANGPYGQQALQLAGLLGGPGGAPGSMPPRHVGGMPYTPGMFMPGFRPGIDQPAQGSRSQGSPARRVRPY